MLSVTILPFNFLPQTRRIILPRNKITCVPFTDVTIRLLHGRNSTRSGSTVLQYSYYIYTYSILICGRNNALNIRMLARC